MRGGSIRATYLSSPPPPPAVCHLKGDFFQFEEAFSSHLSSSSSFSLSLKNSTFFKTHPERLIVVPLFHLRSFSSSSFSSSSSFCIRSPSSPSSSSSLPVRWRHPSSPSSSTGPVSRDLDERQRDFSSLFSSSLRKLYSFQENLETGSSPRERRKVRKKEGVFRETREGDLLGAPERKRERSDRGRERWKEKLNRKGRRRGLVCTEKSAFSLSPSFSSLSQSRDLFSLSPRRHHLHQSRLLSQKKISSLYQSPFNSRFSSTDKIHFKDLGRQVSIHSGNTRADLPDLSLSSSSSLSSSFLSSLSSSSSSSSSTCFPSVSSSPSSSSLPHSSSSSPFSSSSSSSLLCPFSSVSSFSFFLTPCPLHVFYPLTPSSFLSSSSFSFHPSFSRFCLAHPIFLPSSVFLSCKSSFSSFYHTSRRRDPFRAVAESQLEKSEVSIHSPRVYGHLYQPRSGSEKRLHKSCVQDVPLYLLPALNERNLLSQNALKKKKSYLSLKQSSMKRQLNEEEKEEDELLSSPPSLPPQFLKILKKDGPVAPSSHLYALDGENPHEETDEAVREYLLRSLLRLLATVRIQQQRMKREKTSLSSSSSASRTSSSSSCNSLQKKKKRSQEDQKEEEERFTSLCGERRKYTEAKEKKRREEERKDEENEEEKRKRTRERRKRKEDEEEERMNGEIERTEEKKKKKVLFSCRRPLDLTRENLNLLDQQILKCIDTWTAPEIGLLLQTRRELRESLSFYPPLPRQNLRREDQEEEEAIKEEKRRREREQEEGEEEEREITRMLLRTLVYKKDQPFSQYASLYALRSLVEAPKHKDKTPSDEDNRDIDDLQLVDAIMKKVERNLAKCDLEVLARIANAVSSIPIPLSSSSSADDGMSLSLDLGERERRHSQLGEVGRDEQERLKHLEVEEEKEEGEGERRVKNEKKKEEEQQWNRLIDNRCRFLQAVAQHIYDTAFPLPAKQDPSASSPPLLLSSPAHSSSFRLSLRSHSSSSPSSSFSTGDRSWTPSRVFMILTAFSRTPQIPLSILLPLYDTLKPKVFAFKLHFSQAMLAGILYAYARLGTAEEMKTVEIFSALGKELIKSIETVDAGVLGVVMNAYATAGVVHKEFLKVVRQVFPSRLSGFSSRQLSMLANAYLRLDLSDDPLLPPLFRAAEQRLPTCDWHSLALLLQAATKASARGGFEKEFFFSSFSHEASHLICYALLHRNSLHPSKLRALQLLSSSSSSSRILEREEAKISSFSSDLLLPSSMSHVSHDSPAMTTTSHSCGNNGYNERHTVDTASCLDSPSSQLVDGSSPSSSSSSLLGREDQGVVERQNDEVHFLHERKEKKRENKHKKSDASGDSCLLFASDRGKDKEIDFSKFSPPFRSTLLTSHMSSSSASVICYSISKSHSLLLLSSLHPVSTTTSHHHSSSDLSSSPYKSEREEEEEERERVISRDMTSAISIRHSSLVRSPCLSPYSSLQERQGGSCLAHEESLSSLASSTSLPKSEERTKEEERSSEAASEENLVTRKRRKERIFQLWLMAELTQLAMSFVSTFSITELSNTSSAIGQFCEVFQQHLRQKTFLKEETDMSHCILSSSHSTSHGFLSLSASHEEARTQERKCPENEVSTSHVKRTLESDGDHVAIEREERRDKEEERRRGEREEEVFMNGEKREALKRDTSHVPLNDKKEKIKNDQGGDGRERNTFSKMSDIEKHEVRKEGILSQADMTSPHQEKEDEEDQHEIPERKDSPGFCIDESEKELEKFLMATFTDFFKRVEERIASSSISKEFSYFSKRQLHFSELIKILKSFRSFQDCLILGEAQLKDRDKDMSTPTKRKTGDMHLNLHDGSSLEERRRKEESRRREVVEKLICRNVDLLQTVTLLPLSQLMEVLQSLKIENEDLLEIVTSHQHKLRKKKKKISNLHSSTHTLSYPPSPSPSPHSSSPSVHRYSQ